MFSRFLSFACSCFCFLFFCCFVSNYGLFVIVLSHSSVFEGNAYDDIRVMFLSIKLESYFQSFIHKILVFIKLFQKKTSLRRNFSDF